MASGKLLRQLIKTGTEGNLASFREASEQVIRDERAKHHHLLANDLEKILYGRSSSSVPVHALLNERLPKDRERGLPLVQLREPVRRLEDVILSDDNCSIVDELLAEHHRAEVLKSHGLRPADRLLFCGPPGCGKTLTAEVIASELGLPLVVVRIDSVVSSYLGETAANLRQVFPESRLVSAGLPPMRLAPRRSGGCLILAGTAHDEPDLPAITEILAEHFDAELPADVVLRTATARLAYSSGRLVGVSYIIFPEGLGACR